MANNYSFTSFMIPCTEAQATMACGWLSLLEDRDDNVRESIRPFIEDETDTVYEYMWQNAIKILRHIPEQDVDGWYDGYWDAGFKCVAESDGIWVTDDGESVNSDGLDHFIATVLDLFDSDELVCYSVANTCSKKSLDQFGGYAVAVSRNGLEDHIGTWQWMQEMKDRHKKGCNKL